MTLVALLLTGWTFADDRSDYDAKKVEVEAQKRVLNEYHKLRNYPKAIEAQKEIAKLSQAALELALKSPQINNSGAWSYHADALIAAGLSDAALVALNNYFKTPLLDRNGHMNGWRKRAQIYRRASQHEMATKAYQQALVYASTPRDKFNLMRDQSNLYLELAETDHALKTTEQMPVLIQRMETDKQSAAQRDYQGILSRIYKDAGNATLARAAKLEELKMKLMLLNLEVQDFPSKYPESTETLP